MSLFHNLIFPFSEGTGEALGMKTLIGAEPPLSDSGCNSVCTGAWSYIPQMRSQSYFNDVLQSRDDCSAPHNALHLLVIS